MFWLIVIVVAIIAVFSMSGAADKIKETQEKTEFNEMLKDKSQAYADYIKRTTKDESLLKMSENELREYVKEAMLGFKKDIDNASILPVIILVGGIILAILAGTGTESWGPPIAIGGIIAGVAFRMNKQKIALVESRYSAKGFDLERLKLSK